MDTEYYNNTPNILNYVYHGPCIVEKVINDNKIIEIIVFCHIIGLCQLLKILRQYIYGFEHIRVYFVKTYKIE